MNRTLARPASVAITAILAGAMLSGCGGVGQSYDQSTGNSPGFRAIPTGETAAQGKMRARRRVKISALEAALAVHPSRVGPTVHGDMLGADVCVTYNLTQSGVAQAFINAGVTTTRFPGGCQVDLWHWRTGTDGPGRCSRSANPNSTWRNFVNDVALPAHLNVSLGVNYGSNKTCTAGGDPTEAAAWVSAAPARHWWTVGNEQYYAGNPGANALDLHRPAAGQTSCPGNPVCYAYYERAFYNDMHAAAAHNISVCIDGFPQQHSGAWDAVVLANARYDCSEIHFYPEIEGQGNDDTLLQNGAGLFDAFIKTEQAHLATAGRPNVPLFVAEVNRQSNTPGPESIVEGLFAANVVATAMDDGVARLTWHSTFADCNYPVPNQPNVYPSWLPWGTSGMFSGQNSNCSSMQPPLGTLLAVGNSFLVLSSYVHPGEHTLRTTKTGDVDVSGYAETYGRGYQVLLINRRRSSTDNVTVSIDGKTSGSGGQIVYYDKATFDQTQHGIYAGPTYGSLAPWTGSFTVTLTPWSVTSIQVN